MNNTVEDEMVVTVRLEQTVDVEQDGILLFWRLCPDDKFDGRTWESVTSRGKITINDIAAASLFEQERHTTMVSQDLRHDTK